MRLCRGTQSRRPSGSQNLHDFLRYAMMVSPKEQTLKALFSVASMENKPFPLNTSEIQEIANLKEIRDSWGAESADEMINLLKTGIYTVKFKYMSGSPGYVGDLYLLLGDSLQPPMILIRDAKQR